MSHRTEHRGGSRRLEMLQRKLHLSDEQTATLKEKFAEHRAEGRQILRDVLNDEQTERLDKHLARRHRRGHKRSRGKRADA